MKQLKQIHMGYKRKMNSGEQRRKQKVVTSKQKGNWSGNQLLEK